MNDLRGRPAALGRAIPWFGARKVAFELAAETEILASELETEKIKTQRLTEIARDLLADAKEIQAENKRLLSQIESLGAMPLIELEARQRQLQKELGELTDELAQERSRIEFERALLKKQTDEARQTIIETSEIALLQEAGIYEYRHPLADVVAYEQALARLNGSIKAAIKADGSAILSATSWQVNGSASEGLKMVRDISKLMLRAFNAEVEALIRGMKPHRLESAIQRLKKVDETIQRLGSGMQIRIAPSYYQLRVDELELTADYLQKQAEQKEIERLERERMREERKALQEIERERTRLDKEKQHYTNALEALVEKGDEGAAQRMRDQLVQVNQSIESMDFRAANTRAGYVYVISNIGSFGEGMVKVGMTRRLEPMDRIRELSDASVPFNFDVHALFFAKDAVGIEDAMHDRLASFRVNAVNHRREFFHVTAAEAKAHLVDLAGELLQFDERAEAIEYRQTLHMGKVEVAATRRAE